MGNPVIDLALEALRGEGFAAGEAGSGVKAPDLQAPGAAISIHSADWEKQTVTLGVSVLCPQVLGAVRCQEEALRVGEILHRAGARCSQGRCGYDGLSRMYQVEVLAEFRGRLQEGEFLSGPGFAVTLEDTPLPWAISFRAELSREVQVRYEPGRTEPVALIPGEQVWKLELTELLPPGIGGLETVPEVFALTVTRCGVEEVYHNCRWRGEKREFTAKGLQRIRTGICLGREVTSHG